MKKSLIAVLVLLGLCFSLGTQAREFTAHEDRMLEAYIAYYGRPADPEGLAFWAGKLEEAGGNLDSVIDAFGTSQEFENRFGSLTSTQLVNNLYQQIFGRDPDTGGLDFYVDKLDIGAWTLQQISMSIIDGRQNDDILIVGNRLMFAKFYVSGDEDDRFDPVPDVELAEIMAGIDETDESLEDAYQDADDDHIGREVPILTGHSPMFAEEKFHGHGHRMGMGELDEDRVLPYEVQAAFNDDTFFWRVSYRGNEGKRHEYIRYTNGAWQREGGDRRDAQATIDGDAQQGDTSINSTIYEQRTTIMVNDPGDADKSVTDFGKFGCFLACHNDSRHMPEWVSASGHDGKYIHPGQVPGAVSGEPVLDLWHWRGARSNPIGRADDQNILALDFVDSSSGDDGGRKGDAGTGVFTSQNIVDGHPEYVINPDTANGKYAFNWDDFWNTPLFYMTREDAADIGPSAPNPVNLAWDEAVARGYQPVEGDTVPRRVLRAGEGSRADITANGTTFTSDVEDSSYGLWNVQMQRALATGNVDDIALVPGQVYEAGFEVHLWEYTTRDHYVSFPVTFSVGPGEADIQAVSVAGSGPDQSPDWDAVPATPLSLFQPGISSWEFLTGENEDQGKQYTNAQGQLIGQSHSGSNSVNDGVACVECHNVQGSDPEPSLFNAGSMEDLTEQRGGIWEDTPVVELP
jgi:hypothetical protein